MKEDRTYTINLRREFLKKPHYKRAKKSVTAIREFLFQHVKPKEVKIGQNLNRKILERGKSNPPSKVKVKVSVENDIAYVELPEFEFAKPKPKEEEKKTTIVDKILGKKEETIKEEQKVKEERELIKELGQEELKKQKREHKKGPIEVPSETLKPQEMQKDEKGQPKRVVGRTGKKATKDAHS